MEIKFNKKPLSCMQQVLTQVQSQEQTQELKLPDGYPDIGRLLGCWGQVVLRGKEWRRASMSASGGVMAWVLYAPEDGSEPRVLDTWIPFQGRWELPDTDDDGVMTVLPVLSELDGRNTSARKMLLRAGIDLLGQAMTDRNVNMAAAGEVPEDVQLLTNSYPVELPVEAGERQIRLEENLVLPADLPPIFRIISYELIPDISEQKVLANRLVFRGKALFKLRFLTDDGSVHVWMYEIPFSDYTDLEGDYDITAAAWIVPAVTALEVDTEEHNHLQIRAAIASQYVIFDRMVLPVTEDAYSPYRDVTVHTESPELPMLLDRREVELPVNPVINMNAQQVLDVVVRSKYPCLSMEEDGMAIRMTGNCQILYRDEDGNLTSDNMRYENTVPFASADENRVVLWWGNPAQAEYMQGVHDVSVKSQYPITALSYASGSVPMVTDLELGQIKEADPNRPSLILKRAGQEGLWQIAKKYGSTVDAIRTANKLVQDPEDGAMLLIPVC